MSHTFEGNSGTKFYFNSDLSGQITIEADENLLVIEASDLYEFFISRISNSEFDAAKLSKIMQDFNLLKIEVHDWNILITKIGWMKVKQPEKTVMVFCAVFPDGVPMYQMLAWNTETKVSLLTGLN